MKSIVITSLRKSVIVFWLVALAAISVVVGYRDLSGDGLQKTIYFHAIGYALYPLFYGSIISLIAVLASMFARAEDYISLTGDMLKVGKRRLNLDDLLSVEGGRNRLGFREIIFEQTNHDKFALRAYILAEPYDKTLATLRRILAEYLQSGAAAP